jgi:hypothetical protein
MYTYILYEVKIIENKTYFFVPKTIARMIATIRTVTTAHTIIIMSFFKREKTKNNWR